MQSCSATSKRLRKKVCRQYPEMTTDCLPSCAGVVLWVRWSLQQRDLEVGEANKSLMALRDELQQALTDSERLKGLLRSEGAALETARKTKRDADKHYKSALEECRR